MAARQAAHRGATTAGTGSESTTICVVDFLGLHLKAASATRSSAQPLLSSTR